MKQFLKCTVTKKNGEAFENPLMLSEVRLISKLAKEHKEVKVRLIETDTAAFKHLFGL